MIADGGYDVVAISGDVSQRARAGEFQRARAFIRHAERVSRTIVVPGNHDVAWWYSPLGMGDDTRPAGEVPALMSATTWSRCCGCPASPSWGSTPRTA